MEAETCPHCHGVEFIAVALIQKVETVIGSDGARNLVVAETYPVTAPCICIQRRAAMGVKPR